VIELGPLAGPEPAGAVRFGSPDGPGVMDAEAEAHAPASTSDEMGASVTGAVALAAVLKGPGFQADTQGIAGALLAAGLVR
jgi:hypothetical protein